MPSSFSRRGLLCWLSVGTALTAARRGVLADTPARLDVKDPAALALGYVEDAGRVDAKRFPGYTAGSNCENCLQLQGKEGAAYRPCTLFPGKLVAAKGWCSGWSAEM